MNETDSTLPPLLARITHPSMVADLSLADKQILATELRQTIIRTVAANGGHLAPSLGVQLPAVTAGDGALALVGGAAAQDRADPVQFGEAA